MTDRLRKHLRPVGLVLVMMGALAPLTAQTAPPALTVSVASSLSDVMGRVVTAWRARGGGAVALNAAGSQVLARQIVQGAPVDVFFSADAAQMKVAAASGRLVEGSVRVLLTNRLVVIVPATAGPARLRPADLTMPRVRRVALGQPDSVPAGVYARQWFEAQGVWQGVAPKVVPVLTARAALAAVAAGRADAGLVFATDALASAGVRVAYEVPAAETPGIAYPVAVVRTARAAEAQRFVDFLQSAEARTLFEAAGFGVRTP
ncbi:MAG: molybdate ABC transporter substrate-binding protein [Acidobacteria bacterium]|nr:molybdate ABC transporter substrate-binding protein [Acidobacteriota bacterium]